MPSHKKLLRQKDQLQEDQLREARRDLGRAAAEAEERQREELNRILDAAPSSPIQHLPGGTTRSEKAPPFHLTPPEGARRIAQRFGLGAATHGEDNWKLALGTEQGRREFVRAAVDHMQEHLLKLLAYENPEDDHLGAIGWGVYVLAYIENRYGPLRRNR